MSSSQEDGASDLFVAPGLCHSSSRSTPGKQRDSLLSCLLSKFGRLFYRPPMGSRRLLDRTLVDVDLQETQSSTLINRRRMQGMTGIQMPGVENIAWGSIVGEAYDVAEPLVLILGRIHWL